MVEALNQYTSRLTVEGSNGNDNCVCERIMREALVISYQLAVIYVVPQYCFIFLYRSLRAS